MKARGLLAVNSLDSDLPCSQMGSIGHYMDFVVRSWQGKACVMSGLTDSDISHIELLMVMSR